jgi:ferredoxin/flavodoxin
VKLQLLYFSGTGNTDYVARYLAHHLAQIPEPSLEIDLRPIEWQPANQLDDFDLIAVGFPVYAANAPGLFQDYLDALLPGEGRGAFVFCTKGAYAGGAVQRALQRLATRSYTPLGGGSVIMPGTDGLSMIAKDSWLARKALEKDYEHLEDADRLLEDMVAKIRQLASGHSAEALRLPLPPRARGNWLDRFWEWSYRLAEGYARNRLYADQGCTACGLCERICPVRNIEMSNDHPQFADRCMLCLRCLHACPQEAIQVGRLTVGKFRWRGPQGGFQPLKMRPDQGRVG